MLMLMMNGSSSVLDGWLVANYLMMSIANGGAGQKKIGKIRQQRSFTLGEIFFLVVRSSKSNGSLQQVFVRKELGATFPSLYGFDLSKGLTTKIFSSKQFHDTLGCNFRWLEYYSAAAARAGAGGGHNTQSNH